jgi:hypothetical protein
MSPRALGVAWIVVASLMLTLLAIEASTWGSVTAEAARLAGERDRLTNEIGERDRQIAAEMRRHATLLQHMQWTANGGDPAAFLRRLAELAQAKRMRITAIGPIERQVTPQFVKSWHTVQIQAPYREVRELAARVEQDRGLLEDVRLEVPPPPSGTSPGMTSPQDEVQARFKIATLELSAAGRQIVARVAGGATTPTPSLVLPVPRSEALATALSRDPFAFPTRPAPALPPAPVVAKSPEKRAERAAPVDLKGIFGFPGGFLAILNDQIVRVGDTVSGHRVEQITDKAVTIREPGAAPRTIDLPDVATTLPASGEVRTTP